MNLETDIQKTKKKLITHCKRYGLHENFGQKDVRRIEDKYEFILLCYSPDPVKQAQAQMIFAFRDWCENYTGR